MSKALNKKQPLPWWRRILLGLVLAAMVPFAALMLINYLAERQLAAEIVKISRAGEPITFLDLRAHLVEPNSTGENAAHYYAEALSSIPPSDLENLRRVNTFYRKNIISLPKDRFPDYVREKVTQNLAGLQPALENFDKGAGLALSGFDIGIEQGMEACKTCLRRMQTTLLLLSLRTLDMVLSGEDDAAANSVISILKMTRTFDPHPTMVLHSVKAVFVAHACQDINLLLEHGRPSEQSLARLQRALSQTIPPNTLERMFLAERVYQIEIARNLVPEDITSRFLQDKVPDLPERLSLPTTRWAQMRIRQKSVRYLHNMAQLIAAAHRPWPEPLDAIVANRPRAHGKIQQAHLSGAVLIRFTAETLAFVRSTILAIAIERYRRSHAELLVSLDDLCPAYIESIPLDPFTGKKLLYRQDAKSYVVYSVGVNRQDDSGSVIPKADVQGPQDCGVRIRFRKTQ